MNCEAALELISQGRIDDDAVAAHLAVCPRCRVRAPSAVDLGEHLRDPMFWEEPPPHLRQAVVDAIAGKRPPRRRPLWLIGVAATLGLVIAVGVYLGNRPDWMIELEARPAAPAAWARVSGWNMAHGTKMRLEVDGLAPTGTDAYYEVWLTAPDGRHVSAGTFRTSGKFEMMAGVPRSEFPRIWITLEPADDDPSPNQATVLDMPEA